MATLPERLFADADDAVLVIDPGRDRIEYANGGACRLLGYEPADLLAMPISSTYRGQARELDAFLARVIEHGHASTRSLTLRTGNGKSFPAELSALLVERGSRRLVLVLARDRSQHRRHGLLPLLGRRRQASRTADDLSRATLSWLDDSIRPRTASPDDSPDRPGSGL